MGLLGRKKTHADELRLVPSPLSLTGAKIDLGAYFITFASYERKKWFDEGSNGTMMTALSMKNGESEHFVRKKNHQCIRILRSDTS
jgi:hypothetical protein